MTEDLYHMAERLMSAQVFEQAQSEMYACGICDLAGTCQGVIGKL
jgi:hypothetical protein